jgi:DNA polymerase elongation subunit (family B)
MPLQAIGAYFDGSSIVHWTRSPTGERVTSRARAEFACYLSKDAPTEVIERLRASSAIRGLKLDGDWYRLHVRDRDVLYRVAAPRVRDMRGGEVRPGLLPGLNVQSYEADLDPVRRWALENTVEIGRPRRCYLDIEADSRVPIAKKESARMLTWTIGDDESELITGCLEEDTDEAERELLLDLVDELERYDQIAAWYGDGYDFPVLRARLERQRIRVDMRRWLCVDHLPVFQRMNISSSKSGDEKQSMSLDNIAWSVAGMRKVPFDSSQTWEFWSAGGEQREYLCRYNAHDVRCMIGIEQKTGYLELHNTLSQTCGVFPDTRASNPLRYVDNMMLKLAHSRGQRLPTRYGSEDTDPFEGAFVFPATKGLVRDVEVVDFASMYPSIIRSWNISFDTITDHILEEGPRPTYLAHTPPVQKKPIPEGCCESPSGSVFRNEPEGLLALGVGEALRLRKHWTKLKATFPPESPEWIDADRRSTGYKIVSNTFYGVQGCQFFRLFNRDAAEAVTLGGQWMIKEVAKEAERRGMRAIGGDTDSLFIAGASRGAMAELVQFLNDDFFPRELKAMGATRCELRLEHEKGHELMLVIAKKNYAARYAHYKGQAPDATTKPEVKGLEYKRGDAAKLARDMQAEILDLLLGGGILGPRRPDVCLDVEQFRKIVLRWRDRVLEGVLTRDDVKTSKRLKKPIDGYAIRKKKDGGNMARPPHVEIAASLIERGIHVAEGFKVDYFVVDGSCSPMKVAWAGDWDGNFDRFHLWENTVYPAAFRVLDAAFPDPWWKTHAKVRPKKLRHVLPGQGGFGFGEAPAPSRS